MARPREFDVEKAVGAAMNVFWEKGYQATSLPDLLNGMGIVRGSFYKAFGSKKALFLRALEMYHLRFVQPGVVRLNAPDVQGLSSIRLIFDGAITMMERGDKRGCLLCNSAAESAFHDPDIAAAVQLQLNELADGFSHALGTEPGYEALSKEAIEAEAHRLSLSYVGLRVMQRSGQALENLRSGVESMFQNDLVTRS